MVGQLMSQGGGHSVRVLLNDDGSSVPYAKELKGRNVDVVTHRNHGKRRYWELVTKTFQQVRGDGSDFLIYLSDDMTIGKDFFSQAIEGFNRITDRGKICLSYIILKSSFGRPNWTGVKPREIVYGGFKYHYTQWTDMAFICTHKMLQALDYRVPSIPLSRWAKDPTLGSGVGRAISQALVSKKYSLYHLSKSIATFKNPSESKMNKESRKEYPAITL